MDGLKGLSDSRLQLVRQLLPDSATKILPSDTSDESDFSAAIKKLDSDDAKRVNLLLHLAEMSDDDQGMVQKLVENSNVKSLRDVALLYNADDLAGFTTAPLGTTASSADSSSSAKSVSKTVQTSSSQTVLAATAARKFRKKLFIKEPTAVLQKMAQDAEIHSENEDIRGGMLSFFSAHPEFNIRNESIIPFLKHLATKDSNSKPRIPLSAATVKELKRLQRVQALTSDPATISPLLSAGIRSAQQVAAIPQAHFISDMQIPDDTARAIHRHATDSVIRSNMALTTALQTVRGTGIRLIDGGSTRKERIEKAKQLMVATSPTHKSIVDLEQLFGSMDYCECSDCLSVTSPANYLVELLQFLRNNNLDPNAKPTPPAIGWAGTALEKLFRRRPDLADLELTCANTNTVLPYIDLSNEVMESFVVHLKSYVKDTKVSKQAKLEVFNIEPNDDSAELLAQPRNVNYEAYCILKDAVYPFTLPYHQPIDETRILLNFLKTSRYELMSIFRMVLQSGTPDIPDSTIANNRAITAEYLLLTQEDYKILTLEAFYSKNYFETVLNQPNMSDSTYQANIGVVAPYAYWGYADAEATNITNPDETTRVGLTFVKAQFLPRSGLAYTDVVALVQTQYVNPNWPKGWALELLEKIRFSYAFLYSLIDNSKSTKEEQLAPVIDWLAKWQPVVELFEKMKKKYLKDLSKLSAGGDSKSGSDDDDQNGAMGACGCHCDDYCIWKCWVLRYFELFGKLVVLDSKEGPMFSTEGWLVLQKLPPPGDGPITVVKVTSKPATPPKPTSLVGEKTASEIHQDQVQLPDNNTLIGYLSRDGSITTTSPTGVVTQVGHIASNSTLIFDQTGKTFVQQYSLSDDTNRVALLSIDETTEIGYVNKTTDQLEVYQVDVNGNINKNKTNVAIWGPIKDTCNLDSVRIIHLDGNQVSADDYGRWQRFIRLWLKLGWTMDELDQALIGLANLSSPLEDPGNTGDGGGNNGGTGTSPPGVLAVTWSDLQDKCPGSGNNNGGGDDGDDGCSKHCPLHTGDNFEPPAALNITPSFLDQLAAVKELQKLTGLDLSQLLVFWADIGIHSGATPSLYQKLFLTTSMIALDPIFQADANGNYLTATTTISAHASAVMAALKINRPSDLATIISIANITDGNLTLDNVSILYRYKLLSNVLSISVSQLPAFVSIFGNPFTAGAIKTLEIYKEWSTVSDSGFSLTQLRYLVTGIDDTLRPVGPSTISVLKTCKTLSDGLSGILIAYPDPDPNVPVTSDMVQSAAGVVFDSVTTTAILGVLNGTSVWTTNAPIGLKITFPDSLSKILKYIDSPATVTSAASATVTSTGILTADEATAAKALVTGSSATVWAQAIGRLLKQPAAWFKNTLAGVFTDASGAMNILAGDVPAGTPAAPDPNDPTVPPPAPDPGTAPGKLKYFLTNFLPFLRETLEQRLVIDTMTSTSGLSSDLTALLLSDVLTVTSSSGSKETALDTLIGLLHEPSQAPTSSWSGYLIAPSTDNYTFVATGDTQPAAITVGGIPVPFPHQQDDPNNIWSSDPVKLTAGALITLTDVSGPATQLKWKTTRSPVAPIPSSALLPAYATQAMTTVFVALVKAGITINGFALSFDEVTYFQKNGTDFGGLDFNALSLKTWNRLAAYVNLRQSLQAPKSTLITLFQWAVTTSNSNATVDADTLVSMIVASTAWDPIPIKDMIDPKRFNLASVPAYRNEVALTKLWKALTIFKNVGGGGGSNGAIDVPALFSWAQPLIKFDASRAVAAAIRKSIRGRYDLVSWEQAVQPLNNTLREDQKNALIAYLLVQPVLRSEGIKDADSLFEFFLIDVQMSSCLQTSRIKQAISTVQLFIQRCLLGLELDEQGNPIRVDSTLWTWMSKYVVWQANREVFLYPENWLIPSLRDDKTPFYRSLESSLMQKSVNSDAVSDAFKTYFYNVDMTANLLVRGLYLDISGRDSILHIISCSRHAPQEYYYRQLDTTSKMWTPWEAMSVDIPSYTIDATRGSSGAIQGIVGETGSYVTPVVWNGRVLVFFPTFTKKSLQSTTVSDSSKSMNDLGNAKPSNQSVAVQYWYITMNVSERRNGVWTPKQLSAEGVYENITGINNPNRNPPYVMPPVNSYIIIPRCVGSGDDSTLHIDVLRWDSKNQNQAAVGRFDFVNGRLVRSSSVATGPLAIKFEADFGAKTSNNQMHSWQASTIDGLPEFYNSTPYASYTNGIPSGVVQLVWQSDSSQPATNFYHGFVHQVLARISTTGKLDDVFNYYQKVLPKDQLSDAFGGNPQTIYHELMQPYAEYNWEPCYHALMELATQMLAQSQFDQALALCQYMFNPMVNSNEPTKAWLFRPFQYIVAKDYLENFFNTLRPGVPNNQITEWRNNAFQPYVVARSRPVAFMKALVMLYIQILIAYGDDYFRQNTLETVPLAIQCYVVASHIYGQPGQKIPKRGKTEAQTFRMLSDKLDAFDDAVVDLELMFPFSNQIDTQYPIGFTDTVDTRKILRSSMQN
jgi:ABC toxin-like protein/neuraminidase-like protein